MAKIRGTEEWKWYAVLSVAAVVIIVAGELMASSLVSGAGVLILLFSGIGVVYAVLKERPS